MKIQLKPGEAVKFGGRRVIGTEDNPAFLVGDEVHLRPLVKQGLADEVLDKVPPPPPPPPAPPEPDPGPKSTESASTAPAPAESPNPETAAASPASTKRKK